MIPEEFEVIVERTQRYKAKVLALNQNTAEAIAILWVGAGIASNAITDCVLQHENTGIPGRAPGKMYSVRSIEDLPTT